MHGKHGLVSFPCLLTSWAAAAAAAQAKVLQWPFRLDIVLLPAAQLNAVVCVRGEIIVVHCAHDKVHVSSNAQSRAELHGRELD